MKTSTQTTTALLALLHGAAAHMRMQSPTPFGRLLSNVIPNSPSPLGPGIEFPCQAGPAGIYDFSNATKIKAGDSTLASFIGEVNEQGEHTEAAVHGGGSCQFSLSKTASADPKDWKVIKTFIGGCPATAAGNIDGWKQCTQPDSDETECVKSYNIQIPKQVPSGKYFFHWTWFNKIGNREMYTQCSPIEVTDGGNDEDYLDTLPSIFYANDKLQPCATGEGPEGVLGIVNPGLNVVVSHFPGDQVDHRVLLPCNNIYGDAAKAPNYPAKGSAGGTIPAAVQPSQAPPVNDGSYSTPAQAPPAASEPAQSAEADLEDDGSVITATSYYTTTVTAVVAAPGASSAAPQAPAADLTPGNDSGSCAQGKLPCTAPEGDLVCVSLTQFGLCDHGCLIPQDVAPGTVCQDGAIKAANIRREATNVDTSSTRLWLWGWL